MHARGWCQNGGAVRILAGDCAARRHTATAFDPSNPFDPAYRWDSADRLVKLAAAHGVEPLVHITEAPTWAERGQGGRAGINNPDPIELGRFAEAAARRYRGNFGGLPRVRAWEVWSEPNASFFLFPQREGRREVSPGLYRRMVNKFSSAVHRVHPDNRVVAGGLFPFIIDRAEGQSIGPLRFMRALLCISKRLRPKRRCGEPVHFDVWSHHPYGPTTVPGIRTASPSVSCAECADCLQQPSVSSAWLESQLNSVTQKRT